MRVALPESQTIPCSSRHSSGHLQPLPCWQGTAIEHGPASGLPGATIAPISYQPTDLRFQTGYRIGNSLEMASFDVITTQSPGPGPLAPNRHMPKWHLLGQSYFRLHATTCGKPSNVPHCSMPSEPRIVHPMVPRPNSVAIAKVLVHKRTEGH